MARVGEEFPLECPNCGGDIRLRATGRQEPAHFEPEVRSVEGQDGFARVKSNPDPPRRTARTASAFTCTVGTSQPAARARTRLIERKTVADVPLARLAFTPAQIVPPETVLPTGGRGG
jgi:hypothetical protein